MLNLKQLEKCLDKALSKETPKSLKCWLKKRNFKNMTHTFTTEKGEFLAVKVPDDADDRSYSVDAVKSAMKEYAQSCCEDVRQRCADGAKTVKTGNSGSYYDASIDKQSILNTEIILP